MFFRYLWSPFFFVVASLAVSCAGRSGPSEDSESHFVSCKVQADCEKLGAGYSCTHGRCELTPSGRDSGTDNTQPNSSDVDASSSGGEITPPDDKDSGSANSSSGGAGPDASDISPMPDAGTPPAPNDVLDPNQDLEPYKFTLFDPGFQAAAIAGIAVGPDGRIWFTDYATPNLHRLNADGTWSLVTTNTGGQHHMVSGSDGHLWVSQFADARILKVSPGEGRVAILPSDARLNTDYLIDLAGGPAGEVAFVGPTLVGYFPTLGAGGIALTEHPITQFEVTGELYPGGNTTNFGSIVFGPDNQMWVGAEGGFRRVSLQGKISPHPLKDAGVCGTLLPAGQQVWVFCSNNVFYRFAAGGTQVGGPGAGSAISTGVLAADGTVWGLLRESNMLLRWDSSGTPLPGFELPAASGVASPYFPEMALGPDGHLWLPMERGVLRFTLPKVKSGQ